MKKKNADLLGISLILPMMAMALLIDIRWLELLVVIFSFLAFTGVLKSVRMESSWAYKDSIEHWDSSDLGLTRVILGGKAHIILMVLSVSSVLAVGLTSSIYIVILTMVEIEGNIAKERGLALYDKGLSVGFNYFAWEDVEIRKGKRLMMLASKRELWFNRRIKITVKEKEDEIVKLKAGLGEIRNQAY